MKNNASKQTVEIIPVIGSILLCQLAGVIGSAFTMKEIPTWYASLAKPWFNPPPFIFGPVWLTLYTVMGISLYRVYRHGMSKRNVKHAVYLFCIQLVFNSLWSIVFFGMKELGLAFVVICILWGLIASVIIAFRKIDKWASYTLIPYLLWVTFASILNFSVWLMNT